MASGGQHSLLGFVAHDSDEHLPPIPPKANRGLRYAVNASAAFALVAVGVAIAPHMSSPAKAKLGNKTQLNSAEEGSCAVPKGWCEGTESREDTMSYRDCDGDGVLDPYCEGGELMRFGFISSKNNCEDNWPHGLCTTRREPSDQVESTEKHAAPNEITIIHFNDVYNVAGVLEAGGRSGGMSRAAHVVNEERKRNPDRTFVVFAGDALSPSVLSTLFEGKQMIDVLNDLKLDAASLGNHEFDFGMDKLQERIKESKFPWLNINLADETDKLLQNTQRHLIKNITWAPRWDPENKSNLNLCFFGVAYDVRETMFRDQEKVSFRDVFASSKEEVKQLKKQGCKVIVPLTHQFSHEDCELSKQLGADVDLILGGHDHSTEMTSVCGHAPYVKAASDLKTQWIMTLWLDDDGKVESVDGKLLSLTDADPFDKEVHGKIVEWIEKGEEEMGKKLGCLKTDLDAGNNNIRSRETNMANFFTDAVKDQHKTDVVMINGGTMRGDKIYQAGDLTRKTLTAMHPFGNKIVKIYATGKQIREYIDENLGQVSDFGGCFVQVSGLRYEFDPDQEVGKRVTKLTDADGKDIKNNKKFTVAMTDYMLAHSKLSKNKLYNMVTLNDAVPIVEALFAAAENAGDACIDAEEEGRIKNTKA